VTEWSRDYRVDLAAAAADDRWCRAAVEHVDGLGVRGSHGGEEGNGGEESLHVPATMVRCHLAKLVKPRCDFATAGASASAALTSAKT
jgi:hypothetical protein